MLAKYPQIRELYKPEPMTFVLVFLVAALQLTLAYLMRDKAWWFTLLWYDVGPHARPALALIRPQCRPNCRPHCRPPPPCPPPACPPPAFLAARGVSPVSPRLPRAPPHPRSGYFIGGVGNQSLFLAIHEVSHNTVFGPQWKFPNWIAGYVANTPIVVPVFSGFKKYHSDHHTLLNVEVHDVDIPSQFEAANITNPALKAAWLSLNSIWYAVRPLFTNPKTPKLDDYALLAYMFTVDALIVRFWGVQSLLFLAYASVLAGGLHPLAGHFLAEHYVFVKGQETYSYYGILNFLTFGCGYHVEHHDFPRIPFTKLPLLHKIAPEFYQDLYCHTSWVWVLWSFLTKPELGLRSRYQRPIYVGCIGEVPVTDIRQGKGEGQGEAHARAAEKARAVAEEDSGEESDQSSSETTKVTPLRRRNVRAAA